MNVQDITKKKPIPTIPAFSGEVTAIYIFEKIMHRQRYGVTDLEVLIDKIEDIVSAEMKRQKKHREKVLAVKLINADID